ncbi:MAG: sigma-70 family RNA polymerase sigma factor [Muribaculaceae bacterium]|nr:sigma-70 family RNA polymerase sigma factor [Muribaculaceae bacterium]MDE6286898.1 sigma-70 family RNA polymerase sigma factor [Muribaculaceae bacterium]MDE6497334.1 sigma-70 family RNA polymerase sigma factor [Muribaculaceae bacterium]
MLSLKTLTDDMLVASYAQGNNEAFDELLARHQARIYNYILMMVKDEDVANDIFQDTFAKVVTTVKQGRYTESGRFAAWLTRIARNLIIDMFRQEKSQATVSTDASEVDILNRREFSDGTIEDDIVDLQIRDDVRSLLRQLPQNQREVLVMRYYRNLSFKEIAAATGVSINTALGRVRYAIMNMRRMAAERNIELTR